MGKGNYWISSKRQVPKLTWNFARHNIRQKDEKWNKHNLRWSYGKIKEEKEDPR